MPPKTVHGPGKSKRAFPKAVPQGRRKQGIRGPYQNFNGKFQERMGFHKRGAPQGGRKAHLNLHPDAAVLQGKPKILARRIGNARGAGKRLASIELFNDFIYLSERQA